MPSNRKPATGKPEGEKPAPPFKHPGKMRETPEHETGQGAGRTSDESDTAIPDSLTRGERRTDDRPIGEAGSSKSTEPKQGGDAARKAQESGGGAKGPAKH